DFHVTGVQTCALPISEGGAAVDPLADLRKRPKEGIASWSARLTDAIKAAASRHRLREISGFIDEQLAAGAISKSPHANLQKDVRTEARRVGKGRGKRW